MSIRSRSLLFARVASVLLATISGHLYSIDGLQYFRAGERLLLDRSLSFDPPLIWGSPIHQPITPIGLSLVYIPALIPALPLISRQPPFSSAPYDGLLLYHDPVYVAVSWVDPLLVALLAVLVACLGLRLGLDRRSSLLAASPLSSPARCSSTRGRTSPSRSPLSSLWLLSCSRFGPVKMGLQVPA